MTGSIGWLLDHLENAVALQLCDTESPWAVGLYKGEPGRGLLVTEAADEIRHPMSKEVVPEVEEEVVITDEAFRARDGMGEASRFVLDDVGKLSVNGRSRLQRVAECATGRRADDHRELADPDGSKSIENPVKNGAVGNGNQVSGHGERERPKARTFSPAEDDGLSRVIGPPHLLSASREPCPLDRSLGRNGRLSRSDP